jgi:broad specificity phosphatase PhoE
MKPKRIFLIRHGESEGNVDRTIYARKPDYALELTKNGINQASEAGANLKKLIGEEKVFFYISPLWRTRMTFEQIVQHFSAEQTYWREEPRIREQEWGHLRLPEAAEKVEEDRDAFGTFYFRIPDGESAADVYDRVSDFFGTMHRDFEKADFPENVVIVTHGMTIRLFLMRWFHWTVESFEKLRNPKNCQIFLLEKTETGKYILQDTLAEHEVYHPYQRPLVLKFR